MPNFGRTKIREKAASGSSGLERTQGAGGPVVTWWGRRRSSGRTGDRDLAWRDINLKIVEEAQPFFAALDQFGRKASLVTHARTLVEAFAEFLHNACVGVEAEALNEGERAGLVRVFARALA